MYLGCLIFITMIKKRTKLIVSFLLVLLLLVGSFIYFLYFRNNSNKSSNPLTLVPKQSVIVGQMSELNSWRPFYISNFPLTTEGHSNLFIRLLDTYFSSSRRENLEDSMCFSLSDWDLDKGVVVYLSSNTITVLDEFISRFGLKLPPHVFRYRDESLLIYPLKNGDFLTTYTIDNILAVSYQKNEIEKVVDTLIEGTHLMASDDFISVYEGQYRAETMSSVYINRYLLPRGRRCKVAQDGEIWESYELTGDRYLLSAQSNINRPSHSQDLDSLPQLDPVHRLMPYDGFAFYHWTHRDLKRILNQVIEMAVDTTIENKWSLSLANYLVDEAKNGVYGVRIQDSVTSSELVLKIPIQNKRESERALNKLLSSHNGIVQKLIREETIQGYWGAYILPTTELLSKVTDCSRDLRVLYMQFFENELVISWNYSILIDYLQDLKNVESRKGRVWANLPEEAYHKNASVFYGDMALVEKDSITLYEELPYPLLKYASQLNKFTVYSIRETKGDSCRYEMKLQKKY